MAIRSVHADAHIVEAGTIGDAVLAAPGVNLVLLDLGMPDRRGLAALFALREVSGDAPVLVVTGNEATGLSARIRAAGAVGLVSKTAPLSQLCEAIRCVRGGDSWFPQLEQGAATPVTTAFASRLESLSLAERRILAAMSDGSLNKQIAYRLGLSEITVKQHVKAVLRKLKVLNRTQAAILMQFDETNSMPLH